MTSKEKSIDPEPLEPEVLEPEVLEPEPQDIDIEAEEVEEPLEEMDPIELLNAQLNSKDEELAEQRKAYQRLHADTENFKKRLRKEKEDFVQYANEKLLKDLLLIHDDMDRAFSADNASVEDLKKGLEMIAKQFNSFLKKEKVELMETIGTKFNPNRHEVLTQIESEDHEEDTVIQEYRKGYILNGRVMRAAQVVTAKKPAESESPKKKSKKKSTDKKPAKPEKQEG